MFATTKKKNINTFKIAKLGIKTPNIQKNSDYKLNLERSFILSIIFIVLCLNIFPRFSTNNNYYTSNEVSIIQVIDIPIIKPEIIPPPPLKDKEPLKLIKVQEISEENSLKDEIENTQIELKLDSEADESLFASSQLGDFTNINFTRKNYAFDDHKALDFNYTMSKPSITNENSLLLDIPDVKVEKEFKEKAINFETKSLTHENIKNSNNSDGTQNDSDLDGLLTVNKNQFLLKESESTIGTIEFKTWNRINSALDRLNKDRYGELPNNIKRISNGLTINFTYNDGGCHDIFWSKGGKVIIRVSGPPPKSQLVELEKAYDALLRLIYNNNSNSNSTS